MGKFEVWFKKEFDGRAPDAAFLDLDYDWAGELEAASVKDLQRQVAVTKPEDSKLDARHRALRTGDVVHAPDDSYWILTPVGLWASVVAFENRPT
jgi:hypothetical protein